MPKTNQQKSSGLTIFGAIVLALGLFLGFIMSSVHVAASGIAAGIVLIIFGLFMERLDTIVDLLRELTKKDITTRND